MTSPELKEIQAIVDHHSCNGERLLPRSLDDAHMSQLVAEQQKAKQKEQATNQPTTES